MPYTPTTWVDNSPPWLEAANLNKIENGIAALAGRVLSVKDYGAVGNGTTDDTTAIQTTINAANAAGGGQVYFPKGTYITATLTLYSYIHLVGEGVDVSILKLKSGTNGAVIQSANWATLEASGSASGSHWWSARHLTIDANKTQNTTASYGIRCYGYHYVLNDLKIRQAKTHGLHSEYAEGQSDQVDGGAGAFWHQLKVHDCDNYGILMRGPHDTKANNVLVARCGDRGISIESTTNSGAPGFQLSNSHVWSNLSPDYSIYCSSQGLSLNQCYIEAADIANLQLLAQRPQIRGGKLSAASALGDAIRLGNEGGGFHYADIDTMVEGINGAAIRWGAGMGSTTHHTIRLIGNTSATGTVMAGPVPADADLQLRVSVGGATTDYMRRIPYGGITFGDNTKMVSAEPVSVKAYGAVGDGLTNDTTAIQNCVNAVSAAGGGRVFFPYGTYRVKDILIPSDVDFEGESYSTTLKLIDSAGAGSAVLKTTQFDSLTGTNTGAGQSGFQLRYLTIDGNRANNSAGSYGLKLYGWNFALQSVYVRECKSVGIHTEFSDTEPPGGGPTAARVHDVRVNNTEGPGWVFQGPHDSKITNVVISKSGIASKALWVSGQAEGAQWHNLHVWGCVQYDQEVDYNIYSDCGGVKYWQCFVAGSNIASVGIRRTKQVFRGHINGQSGSGVGFEIGSATETGVDDCFLEASTTGLSTHLVKWSVTSSRRHTVRMWGIADAGCQAMTGTPPTRADIEFRVDAAGTLIDFKRWAGFMELGDNGSANLYSPSANTLKTDDDFQAARYVYPDGTYAKSASGADPATSLAVQDDFVTGDNATGRLGELNWNFSGNSLSAQQVADHPGVARLVTGATPLTLTQISQRAGTAGAFLGSQTFDCTFIFRLNSITAGSGVGTKVRIGLSSAGDTDLPAEAAYIEKLYNDTSLFAVCRSGGTEAARSAALAACDLLWHRVRIRRINATTVGFTLDALAEVQVAANTPTGGIGMMAQITNESASSRNMDIDFASLIITGFTR